MLGVKTETETLRDDNDADSKLLQLDRKPELRVAGKCLISKLPHVSLMSR